MTNEELDLFKNVVDRMESGKLSKQEKILFVLGIQGGMYSDDNIIREQLNRVAEICLSVEVDYEVLKSVKSFDN